MLRTSLIIFCLCISSALSIDPFTAGPYDVEHNHISSELGWLGGELDHNLEVFTPTTPGQFPLVIFFPGLACTTSSAVYSRVLARVASWGYAVVGPWAALYNPITTYKAEWVDVVLQWMKTNLSPGKQAEFGIRDGVVIDFENLFLGAQSSGSHVAVNYLALNDGCSSVHGMFLLSPVDGVDPFGIISEVCIDPPDMLNFQVPALILAGGLDSVSGVDGLGNLFPPCAPEEFANERFYNALTGPTVLINTTQYGHLDCVDDDFYNLMATLHLCATNRDTDKDIYRDYVAGEIVAFLRYFGQADCEMGSLMTDIVMEDIEGWVQHKGGVKETCGQDTCKWQESPFSFIRL